LSLYAYNRATVGAGAQLAKHRLDFRAETTINNANFKDWTV
jgi:hypothetical protein